jgi:hypothetical protein
MRIQVFWDVTQRHIPEDLNPQQNRIGVMNFALNSLLILAALLWHMFVLCSYKFHLPKDLHMCRNNSFCGGYVLHKFKKKSNVNNRASLLCHIL